MRELSSIDIAGSDLGDLNPLVTAFQIANQQTAKVAQNIASYLPSMGALYTSLRLSATAASTATLVATGPGYLIDVAVINASSSGTTGMIYDSATTVISSFISGMVVIPSSVGFYNYPMPFTNGLVVLPSTASTLHYVSVTYRQ